MIFVGCLPKLAIVALFEFPITFWKLIISLTPKYKEFSNEKLDNNGAWLLRSLSFTVGGAMSSTSTESRATLRSKSCAELVPKATSTNSLVLDCSSIISSPCHRECKATYQARGHSYSNPNHVHSTLLTLILLKFPMMSEVPKQFPSENGHILDAHNIHEFFFQHLFNMTKRRF